MRMTLRVKIADTDPEFEHIARLNYQTFVEEIPQHAENARGVLVDRFHAENTYFICTDGQEILGMVAVRDQRPFSLDAKVPSLDRFLPPCRHPCEIRLLSVRPDHRQGRVFGLLMQALLRHCLRAGHDVGVISGRVENVPLYEKLGFVPIAARVGREGAWYQPMYLAAHTIRRSLPIHPDHARERGRKRSPAAARTADMAALNFLPGPVAIAPAVRAAFAAEPFSHRSPAYRDMLARAKSRLLELTDAQGVEILMGTGTLANDMVAGQLACLGAKGLVIDSGEFGARLARHARGFNLRHDVHRSPEDAPLDFAALEKLLDADPDIRWIWAVHCETSTGRLNPVDALRALCRRRNLFLCLDCISSLGVTPVDLRGVHLASGVSGKGLGAFTGLCMVFHDQPPLPQEDRLPRYLDLGFAAASEGIPFSGSSNLLAALVETLEDPRRRGFQERLAANAAWLEHELERRHIPFLRCAPARSPAVFTLPLPGGISSTEAGRTLESQGILLSYGSDYLLRDNRLQICLMSEHSRRDLEHLLEALEQILQ
jgi:aspartate aminotransferase-like enzyme/GNAT superfamily N-acetyltransferase